MAVEIKWHTDCTTSILIWTPGFGRTVSLVYQHSIYQAICHDPHWGIFIFCFLGSPISQNVIQALFSGFYCIWNVFLSFNRFIIYLHWTPLLSVDTGPIKTAFIAPGGPFCGQITVDTNIPTLNSCPPAAVSSKSERQNSPLGIFPLPRFPCSLLATTWEQLPWFRPLVTPVSSSAPGSKDCPELIPALIIFKAAGIYITHTQAPVALQLPREAAFSSLTRCAEIATTDSSRRHRSIWPAGWSWTLSKFGFFSFC